MEKGQELPSCHYCQIRGITREAIYTQIINKTTKRYVCQDCLLSRNIRELIIKTKEYRLEIFNNKLNLPVDPITLALLETTV